MSSPARSSSLRPRHGVALPLLFMDSFRTQAASLAGAGRHTRTSPSTAYRCTSSRTPSRSFAPMTSPPSSTRPTQSLEWCPPGHGDVYVSLLATGAARRAARARYPLRVPGQRRQPRSDVRPSHPGLDGGRASIPYVAEVVRADPQRPQGRSPCRPQVRRPARAAGLGHGRSRRGAPLPGHRPAQRLPREQPLGRPRRPRRAAGRARRRSSACRSSSTARRSTRPTPSTAPVIQIESAMGTAIEVFDGSRALLVPRTRFRPVKTTNDLLLLRSDSYRIDDDFHVVVDRRPSRSRSSTSPPSTASSTGSTTASRRASRRCVAAPRSGSTAT